MDLHALLVVAYARGSGRHQFTMRRQSLALCVGYHPLAVRAANDSHEKTAAMGSTRAHVEGPSEMPRLEAITRRDQLAEGDRPAFDAVFASRGRINAPQSMLMYAPQVSMQANALNDALRALLPEADFELAVLGAAREFDIDFVWAAHVPTAIRAGVRETTIEIVRTRGDLSGLSIREQILVSLSRELVGKHRLSAEAFEQARAELGEPELIEVLTAMGYYIMIGCVLIATDMELPAGAARLPRDQARRAGDPRR